MSEGPAGDVPWLPDVQRPPRDAAPAGTGNLPPLLVDDDGKRIDTLKAWQSRRNRLRQQWLDFLGPASAFTRVEPTLEILGEDRAGGVVRQRIRYPVEPGRLTEAYLLKPAECRSPGPGVVVFHSTVDESILEPAGLSGPSPKALGLALARQGFVALCPRNYLW